MAGKPWRVGSTLFLIVIVVVALLLLWVGYSDEGIHKRNSDVTPSKGGVFRTILEEPITLDPKLSDSIYIALPVNQLFDGLVELDSSLHEIPGLADTWTISPDGLTYTFHIREGITFHDGSPLTADDVVFTFKRILRPDDDSVSLGASYLMAVAGAEEFSSGETDQLSGVRALDDHTVEIELLFPSIYFLEILSLDSLRIVPENVVVDFGEEAFGRAPVGTGPFYFVGWYEDRLELKANTEYFLGSPFLEAIRIDFEDGSLETDYGVSRLKQGELDMVEPGTSDIPELEENPDFLVDSYQELSITFLGFGVTNPPLDQLVVRQAIAHAINRKALVSASPEVRKRASGLIPPGMNAYSPDQKALPYDPARSRQLLLEVGYGPDNLLPPIVMLNTGRSDAALSALESIRLDLAEVGIRLVVEQVTWAYLGEAIDAGTAPMFTMAWVADLPDPDVFLRGMFESTAPSNYFSFEDEEVDRLLELGMREMNPLERSDIYRKLERRILSQAPAVPLYLTLGAVSYHKGVHGLELGPLGISKIPFEKVWITDEGERP